MIVQMIPCDSEYFRNESLTLQKWLAGLPTTKVLKTFFFSMQYAFWMSKITRKLQCSLCPIGSKFKMLNGLFNTEYLWNQQHYAHSDCQVFFFFLCAVYNYFVNINSLHTLQIILKYIHACICIYINKMIIHSTQTYIM